MKNSGVEYYCSAKQSYTVESHLRCLSLPVLTHVERDRGWGSAYVTYQLHTQAYIVRCTNCALYAYVS